MPLSDLSDVGINSWDPLSELVMVTCLANGIPSFTQIIAGIGDAFNPNENKEMEGYFLRLYACLVKQFLVSLNR